MPDRDATGFLRCEHRLDGDVVVLAVAGEIDLSTRAELDSWIQRACADGSSVALDLTEVTFLDSSGLGGLLTARQRMGALRVIAASPAVLRTIDVAGVRSLIDLDDVDGLDAVDEVDGV